MHLKAARAFQLGLLERKEGQVVSLHCGVSVRIAGGVGVSKDLKNK